MASIAQMTGTLVDSGCKHIIPVRVSMDTLLSLSAASDQNTLLRDKMRFCAHKSDLLLCVNKALFKSGAGALAKNAAYPHVLSTLGDISSDMKVIIADFYHNTQEWLDGNGAFDINHARIQNYFTTKTPQEMHALLHVVARIPRFTFMGFSLGLGYAHPNSGDNVVSAMIGGMLSVQNGHFNVCTGDMIMWYFDFEFPYFDNEGRRTRNPAVQQLDQAARDRESMHARENGNIREATRMHAGKICIAYPKPFVSDRTSPHGMLDRTRVFAKAVSNARAFDKLDLLICTQSI
jgi:hypothetical protein